MSKTEKVKLKLLDVVNYPLVTEKSTRQREVNQIFFAVNKSASKPEIKEAVETFFEVKVKSVNTLIHKGKTKVFRGHKGMQSDSKKAMVTLMPGETLKLETGA